MIHPATAFKIFFAIVVPACVWLLLDFESCLSVLAPPENRELGTIELSQVVVLIAIILTCTRQVTLSNGIIKKQLSWVFLSMLLIFVLLEEIDYGLHYYEYFMDKNFYSTNFNGFRNVHNQAENNKIIRVFVFSIQIICFGVLPFFRLTIGSKPFKPIYGYFYWSVGILVYVFIFFSEQYFSAQDIIKIRESQFIGETRELAMYLILFVFLISFKNVLIPLQKIERNPFKNN
jgi:hypothetical protein